MKSIKVGLAIAFLTVYVGSGSLFAKNRPAHVNAEVHSPPAAIWECWDDGTYDPCHIGLNSIDLLSVDDGWAVGDKGRIARWDGSAWTVFNSPVTSDLNAVDMITANDGWALGDSGTILHWDGNNWALFPSPTLSTFYDISSVSSSDAWSVAYNGIYHYSGSEWNTVSTPNNYSRAISVTPGSNGNEVWAVGWYGSILRWNGSNWSVATSPTTELLTDVEMISSTDGWAVGNRNGLVLHWDGSSWSKVAFPSSNSQLFEISAASANDVWIIGFNNGGDEIFHWDGIKWSYSYWSLNLLYSDITVTPGTNGSDVWVVGANGSILRWDSVNWAISNNPYNKSFYDVELISENDGWAFGTGFPISTGKLYRWNGTTWSPSITKETYSADFISDADGTIGWAGGVFGDFYYFDGSSWSEKQPSPVRIDINDIEMLTADDVWAVAGGNDPDSSYQMRGVILHRTGGEWQKLENPILTVRLNSLAMLSPTSGFAVGDDGTILQYIDSNWQTIISPTSSDLNSIQMIDESDGWIVGSDGVILRWNGIQWTSYLSPTSAKMWDVAIFDSSTAWAVGDTIIKWDGDSWSQEPNLPTFSTLYAITGLSPYELWAVGQNGVIMHYHFDLQLSINYTTGAAGSNFIIHGSGFPANTTVNISVNQNELGLVNSSESGTFDIMFTSSEADEGYYVVTASFNPSASVSFTIDNDQPLRTEVGPETVLPIPSGIAWKLLFLPSLLK